MTTGGGQALTGVELKTAAPRAPVRWHLVYYLLAAFDVMAICGSLYLNHQVMEIFRSSVDVNQVWANKLGDLSGVAAAASAVNAPGNDVFDTQDVEKETARQAKVLVVFRERLNAFGAAIDRVPAEADRLALRAGVTRINATMDEMLAEAARIFAHFRQNDAESAGRRMATMDRKFAVLNEAIAGTAEAVREIQRQQFQRQVASAGFLGAFEYVFGALIVVMVICVMAYGHRIAAEFKRHEQARLAHDTERAAYTAELEDMSVKLSNSLLKSEAANNAKTAFLTTMSHELRTPLNAIIGFAEIIQSRPSNAVVKDAEYAADIEASGRHLLKLINQILDLARIEAGKMALNPVTFDLIALVDDSTQLLRTQSESSGTAIVVNRPPHPVIVHADELAVRQIVLNLVANAVKFAPAGRVDIDVSRNGAEIELAVRDTGCGIASDCLERIFMPFEQVGNALTRDQGGTGLGLPIVAKLAEAHGGTCTVESTVGKGSRFSVRMPVAVDKTATAPTQTSGFYAAAG
jgi:signal transduction histidine kinase